MSGFLLIMLRGLMVFYCEVTKGLIFFKGNRDFSLVVLGYHPMVFKVVPAKEKRSGGHILIFCQLSLKDLIVHLLN